MDNFQGKCGTCRWWNVQGYTNEFGERERIATHHSNECRLHAPVWGEHMTGDGWPGRERRWPRTSAEESCGDYSRYQPQRLRDMPPAKLIRFYKRNTDWLV